MKRVISVTLFLLVIFSFSFGQNQKIDSLKRNLSVVSGSDKFDNLYQLGFEYMDLDNPVAYDYIQQAKDYLSFTSDSLKIAKLFRIEGQLLHRLSRYKDAITVLENALQISRRNKFMSETKFITNTLGNSYSLIAEFEKALVYHLESLRLKELTRNAAEVSVSMNNIALVYYKMENYNTALKYYQRSLELKVTAHDSYDLDRLYLNTGLCYKELGKITEATNCIEKGLVIAKTRNNNDLMPEAEFALGEIFYSKKDLSLAEKHFNKSFEFSCRTNNQRFQAEDLLALGKINIKKGQFNAALQYLSRAEKIAQKESYDQVLLNIYNQFNVVYEQVKDYYNLSFFQKKFIELNDRIFSHAQNEKIAKLRVEWEERENLKTIDAQNEIMKLQSEAMWQQKLLTISVISISILLILIIVMLFWNLRHKRNINILLEARVKERTNQLEIKSESLQKSYEELDVYIRSAQRHLNAPLASIKGICNVALRDITDDLSVKYFKTISISLDTALKAIPETSIVKKEISEA